MYDYAPEWSTYDEAYRRFGPACTQPPAMVILAETTIGKDPEGYDRRTVSLVRVHDVWLVAATGEQTQIHYEARPARIAYDEIARRDVTATPAIDDNELSVSA